MKHLMELPEKLRNLGIQQAPTEKMKVKLTTTQINIFAEALKSKEDAV